jgi:hypothetical protein
VRRLHSLVYGLPPESGMHNYWGIGEELAATQIEMAHEVRSAVIWSGRLHLDESTQRKIPIPDRLRVPRPFDVAEPDPEPPERMTLDSIRMALMGV